MRVLRKSLQPMLLMHNLRWLKIQVLFPLLITRLVHTVGCGTLETVISTQQNPVHTYGSSGPFVVTLTINNGSCAVVDTLTTSVNITTLPGGTGVVQTPNPTNEISSLLFDAPTKSNYTLELRSVDGRLISTALIPEGVTEQTISVESLPAGLYLIQLTNTEATQTMRLIKRE